MELVLRINGLKTVQQQIVCCVYFIQVILSLFLRIYNFFYDKDSTAMKWEIIRIVEMREQMPNDCAV